MFEGLPKSKTKEAEPIQQETENLPEELKGKSPSEVYEMLREEHNRVLQEEKERMNQNQQGQQGQPQQQSVPIDPFTGKPFSFTQQQPQQNRNQYQGNSGYGNDDDDDEPIPGMRGFMDKQLEKRMGPLVNQTFNSIRAQNRNYLQQKIGAPAWEKYGDEIEQLVNGMTPQVQIDPRAYDQAYKFVQANHLDEIAAERAQQLFEEQQAKLQSEVDDEYEPEEDDIEEEKTEKKKQSLFQGNTGTPHVGKPAQRNAGGQQRKGKRKLTAEEKRVAEEFGMSDDEYREMAGLNTDTVSTLGL